MEERLILGLDQGTYNMSLEHLVVLESKKVAQINKRMGPCQRDTGAKLSELLAANSRTT